MTAAADLYDLLGIFNPHNAAKYARRRGIDPSVYIVYTGRPGDRSPLSPTWQVIRPGYKTDPGAHWSDYGNKTFHVFNRDQKPGQLAAAQEWAARRYYLGQMEWAQIRGLGGAWFPKPTADLITADLKTARAAKRVVS